MSNPRRPKRALAFEPGDDVVGQLDPLDRLAQHELAGMEDEGLVGPDGAQLGQVGLLDARIDERVAMVVEDAELMVEMEVHGGRLQAIGIEGVDPDPPGLQRRADVAVGEDAHGSTATDAGVTDGGWVGAAVAQRHGRRVSRRQHGALVVDKAERGLAGHALRPLGIERIHLALQLLEVLERLVDGQEADEADVVELAQLLHGHLADARRRDLGEPLGAEGGLDGVGRLLSSVGADGPPMERPGEAAGELVTVELLAAAVALDDDQARRSTRS